MSPFCTFFHTIPYLLPFTLAPITAQSTQKYRLLLQLPIFNDARQACIDTYGTDAASIHSAEDMTAAQQLCQTVEGQTDFCWIGLVRDTSNSVTDTFYWTDGSEWDFGNIHLPEWDYGVYPWKTTSSPNPNGASGIDCTAMWHYNALEWTDDGCSMAGFVKPWDGLAVADRVAVLCNANPTLSPTANPTPTPSNDPSNTPTSNPSSAPSKFSTPAPSNAPSTTPTATPSKPGTLSPSEPPTSTPTKNEDQNGKVDEDTDEDEQGRKEDAANTESDGSWFADWMLYGVIAVVLICCVSVATVAVIRRRRKQEDRQDVTPRSIQTAETMSDSGTRAQRVASASTLSANSPKSTDTLNMRVGFASATTRDAVTASATPMGPPTNTYHQEHEQEYEVDDIDIQTHMMREGEMGGTAWSETTHHREMELQAVEMNEDGEFADEATAESGIGPYDHMHATKGGEDAMNANLGNDEFVIQADDDEYEYYYEDEENVTAGMTAGS